MSFFQEYLDDLVMEKVADYLSEMDEFGTSSTADARVKANLNKMLKSKAFEEADDAGKMKMYREAKSKGLAAYTQAAEDYRQGRTFGPKTQSATKYLDKLEAHRSREAQAMYDAQHGLPSSSAGGAGYLDRIKGGLRSAGSHISAHKGKYGAGAAAAAALGGGAYMYNRNKKKR